MARHARTTIDPSATASLPRIGRSTAPSSMFAAIIAALCVAYWLMAIGFSLCCINPTTWLFSTLTANDDASPYTRQQLVETAQVTRAYTVEGTSLDNVYAVIGAQAKQLDTSQVRKETHVKRSIKSMSDAQAGRWLAKHGDTLSLPADAITHLDQVHAVIVNAFLLLLATLVAGIASIVYLLHRSRRSLARALIGAGTAVLVLFAICGIWAATDFNSLFAMFHSLFFAAGTWTFNADSLLICQYPEKFWIAMAIVWFATTAIACVVTLSIGSKTKRNA